MALLEVECQECGHVQHLRQWEATHETPSDVERDTCEECGSDQLDWDNAEHVDMEELKWANHPDV